MHSRSPRGARLLLPLAALLASATLARGDGAARVAIVKSSSIPPFEQATAAVVEVLRQATPATEVVILDLEGDAAHASAVLREVAAARPRVVVPVGSLGTSVVLQDAARIPVVFSMVLYPAQSGFVSTPERAVTGASLDLPLDRQFGYLQRLLPAAKRVGVLYHATETGGIVEAARPALQRHGLTLEAREVSAPAAAVEALTQLMERVEVVWSVADSNVFTPQTTSALILAALRRGIPLIGLSPAHVRSGALAALGCDYADVGRQTGELVLRALRGDDVGTLPPTVPRRVSLSLNLRTAQHLGIPVPTELVSEATEVVR